MNLGAAEEAAIEEVQLIFDKHQYAKSGKPHLPACHKAMISIMARGEGEN